MPIILQQLKCSVCNANLKFTDNGNYYCEHCRSEFSAKQEISNDIVILLNIAISERLNYSFARAKKIYENILLQNCDLIEAHWGLLLSKYGIEYVEDRRNSSFVPTCHRASTSSIFDEESYAKIIELCGTDSDYVHKLAIIEELRKSILLKAEKESGYDIFICYKDKDEYGNPTTESLHATDLYQSLSNSGYKVFFARKSLDKLAGNEYEPIIYSALSTAKIMFLLCGQDKYIESPWVRNEWGRFLEVMGNSESGAKVLVPILCGMSPNALPSELVRLQGLEISKIDFGDSIRSLTSKILEKNGRKFCNNCLAEMNIGCKFCPECGGHIFSKLRQDAIIASCANKTDSKAKFETKKPIEENINDDKAKKFAFSNTAIIEEIIKKNNKLKKNIIINDAYNSDYELIKQCFKFLNLCGKVSELSLTKKHFFGKTVSAIYVFGDFYFFPNFIIIAKGKKIAFARYNEMSIKAFKKVDVNQAKYFDTVVIEQRKGLQELCEFALLEIKVKGVTCVSFVSNYAKANKFACDMNALDKSSVTEDMLLKALYLAYQMYSIRNDKNSEVIGTATRVRAIPYVLGYKTKKRIRDFINYNNVCSVEEIIHKLDLNLDYDKTRIIIEKMIIKGNIIGKTLSGNSIITNKLGYSQKFQDGQSSSNHSSSEDISSKKGEKYREDASFNKEYSFSGEDNSNQNENKSNQEGYKFSFTKKAEKFSTKAITRVKSILKSVKNVFNDISSDIRKFFHNLGRKG